MLWACFTRSALNLCRLLGRHSAGAESNQLENIGENLLIMFVPLAHEFVVLTGLPSPNYPRAHVFKCWRFYLPCVIGALLLSATNAAAATVTVTNGNDSGPGSLRQAIIDASPGDTINFAPSLTTVTLTSGELVIDKNLTITGPGANRLTVTAMYNDFVYFRIFNISSSTVTVSISGMTISNGYLPGEGGGGVLNENGTMTITGCTISNNSAGSGFGMDIAEGGGILNDSGGSLIIINSAISSNSCSATDGEPFIFASAFGGGVDNLGSMTITNCTISGNSAVGPTSLDSGYGGGISNSGLLQI